MRTCPHCGERLRISRLGIRLPPLKARIVDLIAGAGDVGISSSEIGFELYGSKQRGTSTVRMHVQQINCMLEETDWIIVSDRRVWFLHRRPSGLNRFKPWRGIIRAAS